MESKTVTILLVEDDDIDAEAVERAFSKAGIENPLIRAKDGIQALEILRGKTGFEATTVPLMLLVDINMPRMNGIELVREIRNDPELRKLIVFILTTSRSETDKTASYDLNVSGYLIKEDVGADFLSMIELLKNYWNVVEFPTLLELPSS